MTGSESAPPRKVKPIEARISEARQAALDAARQAGFGPVDAGEPARLGDGRLKLALGGVCDFLTALTFWLAWSDPDRLGPELIKRLEFTLILEFFAIHAGGFFGYAASTVPIGLALGAAYLVLVGAVAQANHQLWLLGAFCWLLLAKLQMIWIGGQRARLSRREQLIDWPYAVLVYMGCIAISMRAVEVPRLGISDDVFAAAGLQGAGLFEDRPWQALAAGMTYFSLMGLWRMRPWRWFAAREPSPDPNWP